MPVLSRPAPNLPNSIEQFGLREYFLDKRDVQYPLSGATGNYSLFPVYQAGSGTPGTTYNQMYNEIVRNMQESFLDTRNLIDIDVETIDIAPTRFLVDFNVGDKVSVILDDFTNPLTSPPAPFIFTERVREVQISLTYPDAEKITCRIGSQPAGKQYNLFKKIRDSRERLST